MDILNKREEQEMEDNKKYAVTHGLKLIGTMITTKFSDKFVEHFKKTPQIPPSRSTNVEILQCHSSNHV
jgi:hypothetical protein